MLQLGSPYILGKRERWFIFFFWLELQLLTNTYFFLKMAFQDLLLFKLTYVVILSLVSETRVELIDATHRLSFRLMSMYSDAAVMAGTALDIWSQEASVFWLADRPGCWSLDFLFLKLLHSFVSAAQSVPCNSSSRSVKVEPCSKNRNTKTDASAPMVSY